MRHSLHTSSSPKIIVLMYHRIDDTETDPWSICVSAENFEKQVQFLKNNFNIISSADLVKKVSTNSISQDSICLSFDDGYADNYINAKPILEKYNCPATFFIATAFINQHKLFWWDELELIFLSSKRLPYNLSLNIAGENYHYALDEDEISQQQWMQIKAWKWYDPSPAKRCEVFLNTWEKLKPLPYKEIEKQVNRLKKWSGFTDDLNSCRLPLNAQQLHELSKNNLFTIGLHTHTHTDLQGKDKLVQVKEILCCKEWLADKYKIESKQLAYPYGRYDDETIKAVKALQLDACYTTDAIQVNANADITKLGRYQVSNWDMETFISQFNKWCE